MIPTGVTTHGLLLLPDPDPDPEGLAGLVRVVVSRRDRVATHVARRPNVGTAATPARARRVRAGVARRAGSRGAGASAVRVEDDARLEDAEGRRVLQERVPVGLVRGRRAVVAARHLVSVRSVGRGGWRGIAGLDGRKRR